MSKKTNPVLPFPGIRWRGFTLQLFLLTILPLVILVVGVVLLSQTLHHNSMVDLVGERNLRAVRTAADGISNQLNDKVTHLLAAGNIIQNGAELSPNNIPLSMIQDEFDGGIALFDAQGDLVEAIGSIEYWGDLPVDKVDFFRKVQLAQPGLAVLTTDNGNPEEILELAGVRLNNDRLLVAGFSPEPLIQQTVGSIVSTTRAHMLVISSSKQILYLSGDAAAYGEVVEHPGVTEALNGESGVNTVRGHHGDQVTAFSFVPAAGWGLVLTEDWEEIATPFLSTTQSAPLILIPLLFLALVALWFGARQIVQPLQELESRTARLSRGDFDAIKDPVGGISEIKHLQSALAETAGDLQQAQNALHGYIGAITDGVEKERRGLARELHDDTLQALIALSQRVQLARGEADTVEEQASLDELQRMAENTIGNLRRMVRGLRPIYLEDLGLVAAVEMLAKEITSSVNGLEVVVLVRGEQHRLEPEVELAMYRMTQEALSNIGRHSNATKATLQIIFEVESVRLSIQDNGIGFDVPRGLDEFARQGHYGLLGLAERAELINADFVVESHPGQGTLIQITVPQS